jgi:hypothetical protein
MKNFSIAIAMVVVQTSSAQTFTAYNGPAKHIPYAQKLKNFEKFMKTNPKKFRSVDGAPPEVQWQLRDQDRKTWDITFLGGFKYIDEVVKGRTLQLFTWPDGHQYLYDPKGVHSPGTGPARP